MKGIPTEDPTDHPMHWRRVADVDHPYEAEVDGVRWRLRLGDFPVEPMYTVVVEGEDIVAFDDWPDGWTRDKG